MLLLSDDEKRVPDLLSRTADRWRLGHSTEPWPAIYISYCKSVDGVMLAVQRRAQRASFYRQARSLAFCIPAQLAHSPRTQVQSSHPALAGRPKPGGRCQSLLEGRQRASHLLIMRLQRRLLSARGAEIKLRRGGG